MCSPRTMIRLSALGHSTRYLACKESRDFLVYLINSQYICLRGYNYSVVQGMYHIAITVWCGHGKATKPRILNKGK